MSQRVNIPSQNQPFRRQSSIGGNVSFRNIGENEDNSFITLAKVTRVYYKQGKLDFKLTNTNSLVADQSGNGSGSAPIPVDFFGRRPNGKVFGHYRPVKIGDLIAVAYVNGHKSSPIVIGVYPNSGQDYEIISPSLYLDGDDNNSGIAETALAEQKIYPSMQLEYRSGSGTIAKALNGHSFLVVDDETSVQYSKLWQNYNTVGFFHSDSDDINPLKETAGDWLLIHEDNPLSDDGDNHRTRFFVNKKGEIQIVLMDNTSSGTISVLEGSKDNGFTISQYYDLTKTKSGDLSDDVYEPDFKSATDYVSLNIGKGKQIALDAAGQTKLVIKKDGIYYNDKPLSKAIINSESNSITKSVKDQITSSDDWKNFQGTINKASSEAKDAAEQAKQAGEVAKAAGAAAEAAGKNALDTGDDIKKRIIYYASISKEKDIAIPGKYIIINTDTYIKNGTIKNAYIEDGAIDHAKIANEAVWSSQIANLAVTRAKIADAAIGSAQIEDLAVTDEKVGKLTFDHMVGATLDAGKINVINLTADSIKADTITANKLKIGQLSDITGDAGQIIKGHIQASDDPNSGVQIDGLDADDPNKYTPAKKAFLLSEVKKLDSAAEAAIDYGKSTGVDYSGVENARKALHKGLDGLLNINNLAETTEFDYNTVIKLEQDLQYAISAFHNSSNSDILAKISTTADGKNTIYRGIEEPQNPHTNDIWLQILNDGTYNIRVWDGGQWINPGMKDIKDVQEYMQNLPRNYYQASAPTGNISAGSTWYKLERGSDGNYIYTPYKWENKQWVKMLSSDQLVASHDIQSLQNDLKDVNGNLTKLNNQVIYDKTNIQADYNGKIEAVNKVVNSNKATTDKALSDNLSTAKGYADDRANGALASATKYVDTQLKISKEGLESQILGTGGGVNLALTSDSDWSVPASSAYIGDSNKCIELSRYVLDGDTFSKGDTITYSVHLSFSGIKGNNPTMVLQSVLYNNDWNHAIYPNWNINTITQNSNYEVTLKGTATLDPFPTALGTYILQIRFDRITAGTVKYCKVKIEKGSVATPYVASDTSYRSLIKATDSKIEGAVMKGTDYAGMVITPEHGFTAVANNMNFTLNKTAGFVINNKSDNIFKVDPSGNLTMKGNITAGNISGVDFTGNNLTLAGDLQVINKEDKVGHILLGDTAVLDSQGLSLRGGGLFISDASGKNLTTHIDSKGTFITNKGVFNGSVTATSLTIPAGSSADINVAGNFMVNSSGDVIAKSITITGGTVDAGSTNFKNFSADIITTGTLDANRVAVKNLSAGSITTGTLRSITINNGNNTFRVDPDGSVYANSMHVNNGSIYQGQILGADVYSISNLTSNSLDEVNDATQNWVKLKDGIIELHGANGNHYSSIEPIDVITTYSGEGGSTDVHHGLGILDSRGVVIGSASLDLDDNNRITHSRNFDLISRTQLGITSNYIQAQLGPDVEYGKGALFAIQKDNKVGFYAGDGDNGNELNVTTAGNNNHIAFNTNNFDIDGEVSIKNNHGLTAKNVHVTGWLGVDGSKNSIVRTSQGTVAINAYETAEYYFGDIGEGQTDSNGVAYIGIEKLFNETVNTNIPYQVFLTAYGPGDIWVAQREHNRFIVKSNQPNIKFGWEIKAKRKGYEHNRLQNVDNMIEKPAGIK